MKHKIEQTLALFPEVHWDLWTGELHTCVNIYGWIDRLDEKSDFILIRINEDGPFAFATSSAQHSVEFAQRLGFEGEHQPCKSIKEHFAVPIRPGENKREPVLVNHPRYKGPGVAMCSNRSGGINVLLENGNIWTYPLSSVKRCLWSDLPRSNRRAYLRHRGYKLLPFFA